MGWGTHALAWEIDIRTQEESDRMRGIHPLETTERGELSVRGLRTREKSN